MSDAAPSGLEVYTLEEIVGELRSRYPSVLVVVERPSMNGQHETETVIAWGGSRSMSLGLAEYARIRLEASIVRSEAA